MKEIIEIAGWACAGTLFVLAEPLILIKRAIGFKEERYDDWGNGKRFFHRLLTCALCSGFWIGLIATGDLASASAIAVLAEIIWRRLTN